MHIKNYLREMLACRNSRNKNYEKINQNEGIKNVLENLQHSSSLALISKKSTKEIDNHYYNE